MPRNFETPENDFSSDPIHAVADPNNPLRGPRSRYWMLCIWNLFPEGTPADQQRYENLPDHLRALFLEFQGVSPLYFKAARWKAEIAPDTRRCHIQFTGETKNKKLTRLEVLSFFHPLTLDWNLQGCEPINPICPRGAWEYIGKPETTMPGAVVYQFGTAPPPGKFPGKGGAREGSGPKGNCTKEDYELLKKYCGRAPIETWLEPLAHKLKVAEVIRYVTQSRAPRYLGAEAPRYNNWTYNVHGGMGKTTAGIEYARRNRMTYLQMTSEGGYYDRFALLGFNHQQVIGLPEFNGNWRDGFWGFLNFLDNQMEKMMHVKGSQVCVGIYILFIDGNTPPEDCKWFFPPEKEPRRADPDTELPLLFRRFERAAMLGGGILQWDPEIRVQDHLQQEFLMDLHMLREHEQLCNEHGSVAAGHREYLRLWARQDENAADRANEQLEAAQVLQRVPIARASVMDVLAGLAAEEQIARDHQVYARLDRVPEVPENQIIDLNALPDENERQADAAEALEFPPLPYIEHEAEEAEEDEVHPDDLDCFGGIIERGE